MQSFSRETRRTEKGDLYVNCVDVMKQGWLSHVTGAAGASFDYKMVYMHTRLRVNGVLKRCSKGRGDAVKTV